MRQDSHPFAIHNTARNRKPFYVVQIIFSQSSPSFTSDAGMSNVPGTVFAGTVASISGISQRVYPEEGRATIGTVTVELVETATNGITEEFREQLLDYEQGARDRQMRIFFGFTSDYNKMVRVATMWIDGVTYHNGKYTISAKDRSRELRKQICQVKVCRMTETLTETATSMTVTDTTGINRIKHGPSFQDAPNATVGYLKVEDTGEIIRFTGKDATHFTGLTRGVFGTRPQLVEFDPADNRDNWPEVRELVYLELPGPLMALALATGIMETNTGTIALPTHWHAGMIWGSDFEQASWTGIGEDLYDPNDRSLGFPVRFIGLEDEDAKELIEREVLQLIGCYMATTTAGKLRLRRVNRVIQDNGPLVSLTESNVISHDALRYDHAAVLNSFRVEYEWDGDDYTRSVMVVDQDSVGKHGIGEQKILKFKGLHTARHTERAIKERLSVLRDRYAEPPLRLPAKVAPPLNVLEIGDVVHVDLPAVLDHTDPDGVLDRAMEVQQVDLNWTTGEVGLELFASARITETLPDNETDEPPILDSWYSVKGTNAATLAGYIAASGGNPARLSQSLTHTGHATDVRMAESVIWHDGDLTIDGGVTITVNNHLQLRIKGFLTINGVIDGSGRGPAGATDPDTQNQQTTGWTRAGTGGYLGPSRAGDGCWVYLFTVGNDPHPWDYIANLEGAVTEGRVTAAGPLALETHVTTGLQGLPSVLRGSSGGSGSQHIYGTIDGPENGLVYGKGGAGGAGGAGILIVCRGLGFGPSGYIDTSGVDGTNGQTDEQLYDGLGENDTIWVDYPIRAGSGGGGYPGAVHIVLDGDGVPYPAITASTLHADRGATPVPSTSVSATLIDSGDANDGQAYDRWPYLRWPGNPPGYGPDQSPTLYLTGRNEHTIKQRVNVWPIAHYVQYAPDTPTPQQAPIPPPSSLTATDGTGIVTLTWNWPISRGVDYVEVWASIQNNRIFAEELANIRANSWIHAMPAGGIRWYWIRSRGRDGRYSEWYPKSGVGGIKGIASDSLTEMVVRVSPARIWTGDQTTSPITWEPAQTRIQIYVEMKQVGVIIATEQVQVTRTAEGVLSWIVKIDHPDIETTAIELATQIAFTFTHTPSGIVGYETIYVTLTGGGEGPPGPPGNRVLAILPNKSSFAAAANGYMYLCGYDNGVLADVDGEITRHGIIVPIVKGGIQTSQETSEAWIIYDTAYGSPPPFTHGGTQQHAAACIRTRSGWKHDSGAAWVDFTPTNTMVVIGSYDRAAATITNVNVLGNALNPDAIPVQRAHRVEPGDIQPAAIESLTDFAQSIRPVHLVASLPALPDPLYPPGAVVYETTMKRIFRNVDDYWTDADNHLPRGRALNSDPSFASRIVGAFDTVEEPWVSFGGNAWATIIDEPDGQDGLRSLQHPSAAIGAQYVMCSERIPVDSEKTYRVSFWIKRNGVSGDKDTYLTVQFYDAAGNAINGVVSDATGWPLKQGNFHYAWIGLPGVAWEYHELLFGPAELAPATIPAAPGFEARAMRIGVRLNYHATNTVNCDVRVQSLRVDEAVDAPLIVGKLVAGQIAAGAIQTEQLDAGAVTTEKLAAGAITASKLALVPTYGSSLNVDPAFLEFTGGVPVLNDPDPKAWQSTISSPGVPNTSVVTVTNGATGRRALQGEASTSFNTVRSTAAYPVIATEQYRVEWYHRQTIAYSNHNALGIFVTFYDGDNAAIDAEVAGVGGWFNVSGTRCYAFLDNLTAGTTWERKFYVFGSSGGQIPANAKSVRLFVQFNDTAGGAFTPVIQQIQDYRLIRRIGDGDLEADLVISRLIRTASSSTRVELEGGSHRYPFWIGGGTKPTGTTVANNTKMAYDRISDLLRIFGEIKIVPSSTKPIYIETASGLNAALCGIVMKESELYAMQTTQNSVLSYPVVFKQSAGTDDTNAYRRLQVNTQPFAVLGWLNLSSAPAGATRSVSAQLEYRYDSAGAWNAVSALLAWNFQANIYAGNPIIFGATCAVDAGASWTSHVSLRVGARITTGGALNGDVAVYSCGMILIPNTGFAAPATFLLT